MSVMMKVDWREGENNGGLWGRDGWSSFDELYVRGISWNDSTRETVELSARKEGTFLNDQMSLILPLEEFVRFCQEVIDWHEGKGKTRLVKLTWDDVAEVYDKAHSGGRRARTLPMDVVFDWVAGQDGYVVSDDYLCRIVTGE